MNTNYYPLLPLRDTVAFPKQKILLYFGRKKSIKAIEYAIEENSSVILATQREPKENNPTLNDLYETATLSKILKVFNLTDGSLKVIFQPERKVKIVNIFDNDFLKGEIVYLNDEILKDSNKEVEALVRDIIKNFQLLPKLDSKINLEEVIEIISNKNPTDLCYGVCSKLRSKTEDKIKILKSENIIEKLNLTLALLLTEIEILEIEEKIKKDVKEKYVKSQKEYYLNQKLNAIQNELGQKEQKDNELTELENKLKKLNLSKEAREKVDSDLKKLKMMHPMSAEAGILRTYLEWIAEIPWNVFTEDEKDLKKVEEVLNSNHYGLEKIKERILEYIAVKYLSNSNNSPILCFVGPPGVGKTSLGKSIADALKRNFVRISLGGVRDEAEIRGHRRTYIGALPGKIIQGMKKAKSSNPVFLLDEVDKISSDYRGDPASALLEVLDPEQNNTFNDHYLALDYDLSNVFFITTANSINSIPAPLLDRMEIIHLDGYTDFEKKEISKIYLIPSLMENTGLKDKINLSFSENSIFKIIREYTKEAGVRNLKREFEKIMRKIAKEYILNKKDDFTTIKITEKNINKYLGVPKFRYNEIFDEDKIGVTNGLAWTETGGDVLQVEVIVMSGSGNLDITGKLGDIMKESVKAAMSYVRARADVLELVDDFYKRIDIHVHVPEGAIPKDGPSAGITIATSLISALTNIPVKKDIAMTGEITLRGDVLPIGGLKQKLLAAKRSGIKTIILPEKNLKDLEEIPEIILQGLEIIPVKKMDEVIVEALKISEPLRQHLIQELCSFQYSQILRQIKKENYFPSKMQTH